MESRAKNPERKHSQQRSRGGRDRRR
jgi:hypothetical protein